MKKYLILPLLLISCNKTPEKTLAYPNLPQIEIPEVQLQTFKFIDPSDNGVEGSVMIVKNDPFCKKVVASKQNLEFWKRCGEYPSSTNPVVGLDQKNLDTLLINLKGLKENNLQLRQKLFQVNEQRKIWKQNNL